MNNVAGMGSSTTYYGAYARKKPSLECVNENDRFTVSEINGNGALTYPIALLTVDEIVYAGAANSINNNTYYLYTASNWWTMTPRSFTRDNTFLFYVYVTGSFINTNVDYRYGVRPAISLKVGTTVVSGDGTSSNPYVVVG